MMILPKAIWKTLCSFEGRGNAKYLAVGNLADWCEERFGCVEEVSLRLPNLVTHGGQIMKLDLINVSPALFSLCKLIHESLI
jgi:hypothetical protein